MAFLAPRGATAPAGRAVAGVLRLLGVRRVVVKGTSMRPALEPGDRLVVVPLRRPRPGQVVALPDPRDPRRTLVKRVAAVGSAGVDVRGDDPAASTDSRAFGLVPRTALYGRAAYRYFPASRAGRPGAAGTIASVTTVGGTDETLEPSALERLPMEEVRARRATANDEEAAMSYLRRMVQGRLDIVHADLIRRDAGGAPTDMASLVDRLPEILGDRVRTPRNGGRLTSVELPSPSQEAQAELDAVVDAARLASLPDMGDAEVRDIAERLTELERSISARRAELHRRIDVLQAEIVRRYKTGEAGVDSLLT